MNSRKYMTPRALALSILLTGIVNLAYAQTKSDGAKTKQNPAPMSAELKHDMAEMYSKMGECMKTDKSMEQCQKDIMKDCPVMKKTGHCPLMEGMKPMKGKMHDMKNMDHSNHQ